MVLINVREDEGRGLLQVLDAIRQAAQGSTAITVNVLAACDHDGVCSAKIFGGILQRASVKFLIEPVTCNTEIADHIQQYTEDTDVRSLVLLNCGTSLDLQRLLAESSAPAELRCYVIDAHRPMSLPNLSARHQRVLVIDDADPNVDAAGPPVDEEDDIDEGSEDSEDEKENVWDPDNAQPGSDSTSRKRQRAIEKQEKMERKRRRVAEYYRNSYYASPVALSLFKMAKQVAPPSQADLWVAAVALTGYYDMGLIHKGAYQRMAWEELKEALDRASDFSSSQSSGGFTGDVPASAGSDDLFGDDGGGQLGSSQIGGAASSTARRRVPPETSRRRLRFQMDLRLALYKHWTLEDSIMHSSYFYGAMELSRHKGQRALKTFFATAGIPPHDYGQLYGGMQEPIRRSLHQKFKEHGRAFGLTENRMFLEQFVRESGCQQESINHNLFLHELSCVDAAEVVIALLSAVPASLSGSRLDGLPQTADGNIDHIAVHERERQANVENFWRAFDAVLTKDPAPLREGIAEAQEMAKHVESLARLLKDSKSVHSTRQFRWCKIEQPPQACFRHPLAIRRLAVWMLDVLFTYRPKADVGADRPLLVIVRDRVRDTYVCVGATPMKLQEPDDFGNKFRTALRAADSFKYRYDFFDKSCIEIAAEDFDRFWDVLSASHL